jgi:hypothetical protein
MCVALLSNLAILLALYICLRLGSKVGWRDSVVGATRTTSGSEEKEKFGKGLSTLYSNRFPSLGCCLFAVRSQWGWVSAKFD